MGKASRKKISRKVSVSNTKQSEGQIGHPTPRKIIPFLIFLILLVSFAVYFNTLFNGFVYDDIGQVLENHWIKCEIPTGHIFQKCIELPGGDCNLKLLQTVDASYFYA